MNQYMSNKVRLKVMPEFQKHDISHKQRYCYCYGTWFLSVSVQNYFKASKLSRRNNTHINKLKFTRLNSNKDARKVLLQKKRQLHPNTLKPLKSAKQLSDVKNTK
jgi:hypothetical protein